MEPLTINAPIPFGRQRDGALAAAPMRQACVAVVGQPGSGKTMVQQNLVAGLVRCPDALVWVVDLSRGGLANPWLSPWLDDGMPRPVVDWVAMDGSEAHAMLDAACAVITARRAGYRQWMARRRVDKLPVDHQVPAVYLVIDEGKKVAGARADQKLLAKIIQVADEGRAMAVRLVITGLRGTAETIPSEMMADIGTRIGMSVSSAAEANYLFGWNHRPNPRDTPHPGCGLWRADLTGPPVPFRSFNLADPERIARIAWACQQWRPALDGGSLAGLGPELRAWYAARWDRAAPILAGTGPGHCTGPAGSAEPGRAVEPGKPAEPGRPGPAGLSPAEAARAAVARARRVVASERLTGPRLDDEWARLAGLLDDDRAAGGEGWGDDTGPLPADNADAAMAVLHRFGADGASGTAVHAALADTGRQVSLSRVYDYLNAAARRPRHGVYVHPDLRSDQ